MVRIKSASFFSFIFVKIVSCLIFIRDIKSETTVRYISLQKNFTGQFRI